MSVVPTSAVTGEGIPDLLNLVVQVNESLMQKTIAKEAVDRRVARGERQLQCTILEVKAIDVSHRKSRRAPPRPLPLRLRGESCALLPPPSVLRDEGKGQRGVSWVRGGVGWFRTLCLEVLLTDAIR